MPRRGGEEGAAGEMIFCRLAHTGDDFVSKNSLTGEWIRPSSAAFKPDMDGVSVYRDQLLAALGLSAADCAIEQRHAVISFLVDDVRAVGSLDVNPDPWPI